LGSFSPFDCDNYLSKRENNKSENTSGAEDRDRLMVISSNALFHFTRSMEDLVSILEDDFTARFCIENYANLFDASDDGFTMAFPMLCFCDLPISQLRGHMDFYGSYGLGMKKEWGIKNGLNPVMYMHPGSDTAADIGRLLKYLDSRAVQNDTAVFRKCLRSIIRQIKLYEGLIDKDGQQVSKRFYDEREWRWVPYVTEDENSDLLSLTKNKYNIPKARQEAYEKASAASRLAFGPDDVDYIIVAKESEITSVIEAIEKIEQRYDGKTVKLLTTRIISAEQIRSDF